MPLRALLLIALFLSVIARSEATKQPRNINPTGIKLVTTSVKDITLYALMIDPQKAHVQPFRSFDADGRTYPDQLLTQNKAIAGINANFFTPDGRVIGPLKINAHWYGVAKSKAWVAAWSPGSTPKFGQIRTRTRNTVDRKSLAPIPAEDVEVEAISGLTDQDLKAATYVVGGMPLLVRNGRPNPQMTAGLKRQDFIAGDHPRTAIGVTKSGHVALVVAPSGDRGTGLPLKDFADGLVALDIETALNLDGGSSTALVMTEAAGLKAEIIGNFVPVTSVIGAISNGLARRSP